MIMAKEPKIVEPKLRATTKRRTHSINICLVKPFCHDKEKDTQFHQKL